MKRTRFVLASKSPRRKELLLNIGMDIEIKPADVDEEALTGLPPEKLVSELAMIKATEVAASCEKNTFVIGADTCVCVDGEIFGKPENDADAKAMLETLSGRSHEVYTGYCIVNCESGVSVAKYEKTIVTFRELSDEEIQEYIWSREPMDKAGAYGIQQKGSKFVEKIEGDYFNVVGLPVCALVKMFKEEFDLNI